MLKPKKRKDGAVILSPRLCVAVGKKLIVQDGRWVSEGFHQYSTYAMSDEMRKMHGSRGRNRRAQFPKVIRTVAGWYMRHMKDNFSKAGLIGKKLERRKILNGAGILPESAMDGDFSRSVPTSAGGEQWPHGNPYNRLVPGKLGVDADFEWANHVPNTKQKHYVAVLKSSEDPEKKIRIESRFEKLGDGAYSWFSRRLNEHGQVVDHNGDPIPPVDIKGVHLKQSDKPEDIPGMLKKVLTKEQISELLQEFGTEEELRIINKVLSGKLDEETDRYVDEVSCSIMTRWAKKFYDAREKVEQELDKTGITINLTPQMKVAIQDINVEDAYPKPGEK